MARTHRLGFTLIELLVVLVILGILAAIVIPPMTGRPGDSRIQATAVQISNLKTTIHTFNIDNSRFPTTEEGLDALVTCPPDLAASWKGPYIEQVPLDAWGRPYIYRIPSGSTPAFLIASLGPDGQESTPDDITNLPPAR